MAKANDKNDSKDILSEENMPDLNASLEDAIWEKIKNRRRAYNRTNTVVRLKKYTRYAAIISGFIIIISIFYFQHFSIREQPISLNDELLEYKENMVDSVWTLITENGKSVSIDDLKDNAITTFGDQEIIRRSDTLIYVKGKNNINIMHVPPKRILHIKMNDGTLISADANTTLAYNTDFQNSGKRMTAIDGQAVFNVVHNEDNEFEVITSGDTLFDIGTTFTVKSFAGDSTLYAGVTEGCIKIQNELINKGKEIKVNYTAAHSSSQIGDLRSALFWNTNIFCFKQADMIEIVHSLERWYGVKIIWNKHSDFTFTGNLPKTLSIDKILEIINELSESKLSLSK